MNIVVYRITGQQGRLSVPDWVCRECELTVQVVRRAMREAGIPESALIVYPWLVNLGRAWRGGAYHPPVVLVNGAVYSQKVIPDLRQLTDQLKAVRDTEVQEGGSAREW